ncbi:SNW domain-containing protein 1 [Orobanche hederae]
MVVHRGVLRGSPMKVFREGICLVINFWWEIRCFVERGLGGDPDPQPKVHQLCRRLFEWFLQSKVTPSVPSATMKLKELISYFEIDLIYFDNSLEEGNSPLMDASRVFRQGIGLVMENLWVRRVFIHHLCRSNPNQMLQRLADDISFAAFFCLLRKDFRDKLYSLPIDYQFATNGITKEVASTLMLIHKECLQGIFSSVEILREESLNQDKEMPERIGVAPPVAAVLVFSEKSDVDDGDTRVDYGFGGNREREKNYHEERREGREKIRMWRQKERERERRLEAKDAAMGKMSKVTRDWDSDISEELDLGFGSTKQGTKVMCDGRLFILDTGMSSGFATDD